MYKNQYTQKSSTIFLLICSIDLIHIHFQFFFPSGADAGTSALETLLISPIVFPWCFLICHCSHTAGDMTEFPGKADSFVNFSQQSSVKVSCDLIVSVSIADTSETPTDGFFCMRVFISYVILLQSVSLHEVEFPPLSCKLVV